MPERIQKIIAAAGLASRRTAEQWISAGRVSVDGVVVSQLGAQADRKTQKIAVDGRLLPAISDKRCYIVLHKPKGFASTLSDPHCPRTVIELVDLPGNVMLRPVGRLDIDSEGLLFMTDDGDFINKMTHPRFHVPKTYLATVQGEPNTEDLQRLKTGIYLEDGKTAPADKVALVGRFPTNDTSDVELVLHEGRNRQVRRMMSAVGHPVLRLVRTKIGDISIKGLPSGAWRHLTPSEVENLASGEIVPPDPEVMRARTLRKARPKRPLRLSAPSVETSDSEYETSRDSFQDPRFAPRFDSRDRGGDDRGGRPPFRGGDRPSFGGSRPPFRPNGDSRDRGGDDRGGRPPFRGGDRPNFDGPRPPFRPNGRPPFRDPNR